MSDFSYYKPDELPRPIRCNEEWIESRSCCYTVTGFAHKGDCEEALKELPGIFSFIGNSHEAFSSILGTSYYDTKRQWWGECLWYWMGADGWPSTLQMRGPGNVEYSVDTDNDRLLVSLAVCASCDKEMLSVGDYLCSECRPGTLG